MPPEEAAAVSGRRRKNPNSFLCCFGYPMIPNPHKGSPEKSPTSRKISRQRLPFRWLRHQISVSGSKTVPVDSNVDNSTAQHTEIEAMASLDHIPTSTSHELQQQPPPQPQEEPAGTLKNPKHSAHLRSTSKNDTNKKRRSLGRKCEVKHVEPETITVATARASSPSQNNPAKKQGNLSPNPDNVTDGAPKKIDPLIGMWIIILTLLIMLLWGRVCAILCTCAWFYLIPGHIRRAAAAAEQSEIARVVLAHNPDLSSAEYKQRVVLEGLLERKHRNTTVGVGMALALKGSGGAR